MRGYSKTTGLPLRPPTSKKGQPHPGWSESTRVKIMAKIGSPEYRMKVSQATLGRKLPQSAIEKLRLVAKKGIESPFWKGGVSKANKMEYNSHRYKDWRKSVFERDNYTCQDCGVTGDKAYLTAHHIKAFAYFVELRYELSNGKTLCEDCHSKTDNYKGRAKRVLLTFNKQ